MDFTLAVKSQQGQVLTTPETIASRQKMAIDLASLITQLGGDPTGAFAQGSASIYFVNTVKQTTLINRTSAHRRLHVRALGMDAAEPAAWP